jgi:L-fuculose-phosphate aldolase
LIQEQVAQLYKALGEHNLIEGSSGNVSALLSSDDETSPRMTITPSGGDPSLTEEADFVTVGMDGTWSGSVAPSSEWEMHAAAYRTVPNTRFVVHTHSDACTALACLGEALPPFHYMVLTFGGSDVRCAPYVTFGTSALAALAAEALRDRTACLLANHGALLCAPTADVAFDRMVLLESLCRQYLFARMAGTPRLLTPQQLDEARERFKTYGQRREPV